MPVVNQEIPNLLGGVSQQPATLRDVTEGDEQVNMVSFIATGAAKRPAALHSAVLSATPSAAYDSVHVHPVARNSTDRYRIVLSNGDLKVFDAVTGAEQTVTFPNGKTYLNTTDPARDLRCVTVGEYTYITNKTVVVARASTKSAAQKEEALVVVRAADFATRYTVTIDSTTVEYMTPDGDNPRARADIGTEKIAGNLRDLLVAAFPLFSFTQYGSTLYIKRANEAAFAISASDGLADQGILAIKGSVQRFDELPDRAKNGFIVEITGDPQNKFDNYYVKYNDNGTPNLAGVWEETVKPGVLTSLDPATMPHQLVRGAALLADIKAESIAALPTIGLGPATTLTDNWDHRGAVDVSSSLELAVLDEEQEEVNARLQSLDGTSAKVRAYFDISTGLIKSGHFVSVELYVSNVPSTTPVPFAPADYTLVATRNYPKGPSLYDEYLEFTTTKAADTRLLMMLRYSDATTPSVVYRAYVGLRANKTDRKHIEIIKSTATEVRFDPNDLFPTGTVTTLTVGSTNYVHTTTSDENGTLVAAELAALVGSPYSATVPDDGVILVSQSGTGAPTCVVTISFNNSTTLYNSSLSLITNQLVGSTVQNKSDGSSGTVTSNTATTIVVGSLSGGAANKFVKGDLCDVVGTGTDFVFGIALWKPRKVGNLETIPFPSLVGKKIGELFFTRNRLGFAAQDCIVLAQSGDPLNLFRQTATALLPDDVIDVKSTKLADYHSATDWDETMLLWTSDGQVVLDGQPSLTPETISLTVKTKFINSTRLRPVVAGRRLFFARGMGSSTHVFEYSIVDQTGSADAADLTKDVPTYIAGSPIKMVADSSREFVALLTDADQSKLYVYCYHYASQTRVQNAWSRWEFSPGTRIVDIDIMDSKLAMIVSRPNGVFLDTIDLDPSADSLQPLSSRLDRRLNGSDLASTVVGSTITYTLPFNVATDGTEGTLVVVNINTGEVMLSTSRPDINHVSITTTDNPEDFYIGVLFTARYRFSTILKRSTNRDGQPIVDARGRLQLRYLKLNVHDTSDLTAVVTLDGRAAINYEYQNHSTPDRAAEFRFPVKGRNTTATIEVTDTTPGIFALDSAEWDGTHVTTTTRV
jgi:hypothetical protein